MKYFNNIVFATTCFLAFQSPAFADQLVGVSCDNVSSATATALSWSQSRAIGYEFDLDAMAPLPGCKFVSADQVTKLSEMPTIYTADFVGASTTVEAILSVYPVNIMVSQGDRHFLVFPGPEYGILM